MTVYTLVYTPYTTLIRHFWVHFQPLLDTIWRFGIDCVMAAFGVRLAGVGNFP
jgi:hypothetical protein